MQDLRGKSQACVESRLLGDRRSAGIRVQAGTSACPSERGPRGIDVLVDSADMAEFLATLFRQAATILRADETIDSAGEENDKF